MCKNDLVTMINKKSVVLTIWLNISFVIPANVNLILILSLIVYDNMVEG